MTEDDLYLYRINVTRVIDGDTIVVDVDLGMHQWFHTVTLRLLRVNCPETRGPSKQAGITAEIYTQDWLTIHGRHGKSFLARTKLTDSFGRYLAEVTCEQEHNLSDDLLSSGNAVPFEK